VTAALARAGAGVVVNDPGLSLAGAATAERPADEVVRGIEAAGGRAVADFGSVASWDDAHAMVQRCRDTFGSIESMVHCAGVLRDKFLHQMTEGD
jgi:NAD(P)-dependent dehydrogenase (short-subunit alcohol dehydrogenase family)